MYLTPKADSRDVFIGVNYVLIISTYLLTVKVSFLNLNRGPINPDEIRQPEQEFQCQHTHNLILAHLEFFFAQKKKSRFLPETILRYNNLLELHS